MLGVVVSMLSGLSWLGGFLVVGVLFGFVFGVGVVLLVLGLFILWRPMFEVCFVFYV